MRRNMLRNRTLIFALAATSAVVILPGIAHAQKTPVPPLAQPKPLVLPKVVQETLPNGMRLVVLEDHKQPAVWINLALAVGTVRDPREKIGLVTLVAGLLDKGTETRTESQIASLVDGLGANLGAGASDDFLSVSASGLSSNTDTLFGLLADVVLHPAFPEKELTLLRQRTLASITSSLADAGTVASAAVNRAVYGDHPYGDYSAGSPKTLPTITRDDLKAFHNTYFAPNVATLFILGDITPAQAKAKAAQYFGNWQKKDVPAAPAPPKPMAGVAGDGKPRIFIVDRPGAAQTEIRVSQLVPGYSDPNRVPASLASNVLGGGGFDTRLMREIRVKRGLTYGAFAGIGRNKEAGTFTMSTFTKNATTGEVVRLMLQTVDELRTAAPSVAEVADKKTYLSGAFAISVATPQGVFSRLIPAVLYGGGPADLETYTKKVEAVTPADVQTTFKNLPTSASTIVLVGNAAEIEPQVKDIGSVTVIPAGQLDLTTASLKAAGTPATTNTPPTAIKGDEAGATLLAATVKAHGGDAFLKVQAVKFVGKGTLTPPGGETPDLPLDSATIVTALPGRARFELKTGFAGDIILGAPGSGKPGWLSIMGQISDLPTDVASGISDPVVLLLRVVQEKSPVAALSDTPTAPDGKKLRGFTVSPAAGIVAKVYVEEDTSLVRRVEVTTPTSKASFELGGYKGAKDGVTLPYTLKQSLNGNPLFDLKFDSYEINPTVTDALFEKPAN